VLIAQVIETGWQAAAAPAGLRPDLQALTWQSARVPGTAAAAMRDAGLWRTGETHDFDAEDWWFRTAFDTEPADAGERLLLHLDGIATVFTVWLNGVAVGRGESMWERHERDVTDILRCRDNELLIVCRALAPLLLRARRPRARWRVGLAASSQLRWYRTMLMGRAPGFAPGPAAVGPWRPVWLERRTGVAVRDMRLRTVLDGRDGVLAASFSLGGDDGADGASPWPETVRIEVTGPGEPRCERADVRDGRVRAEIRIPAVARWWPHTHGDPVLYRVRITAEENEIYTAKVGFRELHSPGLIEAEGLNLHVNGVPVFCRGAVWTPADLVSLNPGESQLREAVTLARDAGMNMLRIPGTGCYEDSAFFDLCDELGLLVWQDLMFANFDYPLSDPAFSATACREVSSLLADVGQRPSLAVLCGNSEVMQQAAMLGLPPGDEPGFFSARVPQMLRSAEVGAVYVPSAPCGGEFPFRTRQGIASYFGVGGYRRDLSDVRRAGVRFAAECMALSNVPEEEMTAALGPAGSAAWKAGVPRDAGASWDFDDVRDHYVASLLGLDPAVLKQSDHCRYLRLSRLVSGELMAAVFAEWRRAASGCHGGLILWLRDLLPGAGWGVVDSHGRPKAPWYYLRRALAPVAIWTSDEGLDGLHVHAVNDRPAPLEATLCVDAFAGGERLVAAGSVRIRLGPHSAGSWDAEAVVGHFFDASLAYRFGESGHDTIAVSLRSPDDPARLLAQAFSFPAGLPVTPEPATSLGVDAAAWPVGDRDVAVRVSSRRVLYGTQVTAPGFVPDDGYFTIAPGGERTVLLRPAAGGGRPVRCVVTAANLAARMSLPVFG
jgi:beta-mannosidase